MSLQNLVGRSLEAVAPDPAAIARLLAAAGRNLEDARLTGWSTETRFDASDKAIMQCAMAALQANGYRTLTSQPGPRQTALQALPAHHRFVEEADDRARRFEKTAAAFS